MKNELLSTSLCEVRFLRSCAYICSQCEPMSRATSETQVKNQGGYSRESTMSRPVVARRSVTWESRSGAGSS